MAIPLGWIALGLALCLGRSSQAAPALDELETTSTSVASSTTLLAVLDDTLSTTSVAQQTLMNDSAAVATTTTTSLTATSVSTTLNGSGGGGGGQEASPTLTWPMSTTTKTMTTTTEVTTSRFDAESSAESFESGEATSVASVASVASASTYKTSQPLADWSESAHQVSSSSSTTSWTKSPAASPLWPWMLFVLNGNATVANRRQRDLGTYLRLNLAARLDADYNDVAINRILLTPMAILANISVEPSHLQYGGTGAAGLEALGQGNVTLLELSGHEFQVDRIIRFDEIVDQRTMMSGMEMSSMTAATVSSSEVTVYGAVGAVFLFLLVALLLGLSFSSPCKAGDDGKYLSSSNGNLGYDRDQMDNYYCDDRVPAEWKNMSSPPVIYTEQLAKQMGAGVLTAGHFIPSRGSTTTHGNNTTTLAELHHYNYQSADPAQHRTIHQTSQQQ